MPEHENVVWTSIEEETGRFFNVVTTTERAQITVMTVEPGKVAGGPNTHPDSDQVALVAGGEATVRAWEQGPDEDPVERILHEGDIVHLPAGTQHWVKSTGEQDLVFFSVYTPPEY